MTAGVDCDPDVRKAIAAEINISVLSRRDESIRRVLSSASHVVMYELEDDIQQWRRRDVEGPLFLVERDINHSNNPGHVRHRLLIWNRKCPDDYVDDLVVGNRDMELTDKTIMYCNSKGVTVAIWFYKKEEAESIFNLMQKIASDDFSRSPTKSPAREMKSEVGRPKRPAKRQNRVKSSEVSTATTDLDKRNQRSKRGSRRDIREQNCASQDGIRTDLRNNDNRSGRVENNKQAIQRKNLDKSMAGKIRDEVVEREKQSSDQRPNDAPEVGENPLQRFFPDLKLSDGIAGTVLPENIRGKVVYERDAVKSMLPVGTHTKSNAPAQVQLLDKAIIATFNSAPDELPSGLRNLHDEGKQQGGSRSDAEDSNLNYQSNSAGEIDHGNDVTHEKTKDPIDKPRTSGSLDFERVPVQNGEQAMQESKLEGSGDGIVVSELNSVRNMSNNKKGSNDGSSSLENPETTIPVETRSAQHVISSSRTPDKINSPVILPPTSCDITINDKSDTKVSSDMTQRHVGCSQATADCDVEGKKGIQGHGHAHQVQFPPMNAIHFETNSLPAGGAIGGMIGGSGNNLVIEQGGVTNFGGMHPHVAMMMHHQQQHMMMQHLMQQRQQQHQEQQRQMQMQMCGFGTTGGLGTGLSTGMPSGMGAIPTSANGLMSHVPGMMGSGVPIQGSNVHSIYDSDGTGSETRNEPTAIFEKGDTIASGVHGKDISKRTKQEPALTSQQVRNENVSSDLTGINEVDNYIRIDAATKTASGVAEVQRNGKLGTANDLQLDRTAFRAVLQRMLTDRQLFDIVYQHYIDSHSL